MGYQEINSETINGWCREGWEWGRPIPHESYERALRGDWEVFLTPTKAVPREWFGSLDGKRLLGLASGGGQQLPIFTALGARCTLLDYSQEQCRSERMVAELGISVSVGVSWNKIFAKFGSDYKKPDAVTVITRENYREVVWQAPVRDLLYVGPATERKLHSSGIDTIGQLACASDELLRNRLGKMGVVLRGFARGQDATEVKPYDRDAADVMREIKSYGNGLTAPRDICDPQSAKAYVWMLAESVAQRMREGRARARTVSVGARAADDLCTRSRQCKLPVATDVTLEVARAAWGLLRELEPLDASHPLRGIHVRASDLEPADADLQASLFDPLTRRTEMRELDASVDDLRRRYGNKCVVWGAQLVDEGAASVDAKADNTVHPVSFFHS